MAEAITLNSIHISDDILSGKLKGQWFNGTASLNTRLILQLPENTHVAVVWNASITDPSIITPRADNTQTRLTSGTFIFTNDKLLTITGSYSYLDSFSVFAVTND